MNNNENEISCVGMIMDGNRRWARENSLSTIKGHKEGYKNLKNAAQWCKDENICNLVVYAFSTENWNRSDEEVSYLMDMMRVLLKDDIKKLHKDDVAVHIIGELSLFPEDIQELISLMHENNPESAQHHLWVAASYGGRAEIVSGVNKILQEGKEKITEEEFEKCLWTGDMPDPDIIIRTGGEKRLSNFLSWSSAYSEFFFVDTYWPAFSKDEFLDIIHNYKDRKRNFGK